MSTLTRIVFALIILGGAASHASQNHLVTIKSQFRDQMDTTRTIEMQGSGFLVEAEGRIFVLTASHVSGGVDTQIISNEQILTVVGRMIDGVGDMEIVEVQGDQIAPSFHYDGQLIKWDAAADVRHRRLDKFDILLLNSWVDDPNLETDNQAQSQNLSVLNCELNCGLLTAETLVQPGASGSPLIMKIPTADEWPLAILKTDWREKLNGAADDTYVLRGMAIRRERFFARSSFVPAWRLTDLLRRYLRQNPGPGGSSAGWQVAGTLLYRTFNGIQESAVIAASSGNGVTMDGGGGLASFSEDNPAQVLSSISPFPTGGPWITNWWALKTEDSQGLVVYPLWFDMEHYAANYVDTLPIRQGEEPMYWEMIRMRFGDPAPGSGFVAGDGISSLKFADDRVYVELDSNGEKVSFALDKNGALCLPGGCASKFMPVVEVPGDRGQTYLVDLRAFYLMNVSLVLSDLFKDPAVGSMNEQQLDALRVRVLDEDAAKIKILYRRKRSAAAPMTVDEGRATTVVWRAGFRAQNE